MAELRRSHALTLELGCCCLEAGIWCSEAIISWGVRCLGQETWKVKSCHGGCNQDCTHGPVSVSLPVPRSCTKRLSQGTQPLQLGLLPLSLPSQ